METDSLISLRSQQELAQELSARLLESDPLILLSGAAGSGRSALCELIINSCDTRCNTIFMACQPDLGLEAARELFLQQLLPETSLNTALPLSQALAECLAQGQVVLQAKSVAVIDDIDLLQNGFLAELQELITRLHGQNLLSAVVTAKTEYAREQSEQQNANLIVPDQVAIPQLNSAEGIALAHSILSRFGRLELFNTLEEQLRTSGRSFTPQEICSLVETMLANPGQEVAIPAPAVAAESDAAAALPQAEPVSAAAPEKTAPEPAEQQKKGRGWLWILLLLLAVAAAAYYLTRGGCDRGGEQDAGSSVKTVQTTEQPGSTEASAADAPVEDVAELSPGLEGGLEVQAPPAATEHSVVLQGEDLDRIEAPDDGGAAGSTAADADPVLGSNDDADAGEDLLTPAAAAAVLPLRDENLTGTAGQEVLAGLQDSPATVLTGNSGAAPDADAAAAAGDNAVTLAANAPAAANQVLLSAPQEQPATAENGISAPAAAETAGNFEAMPAAGDAAAGDIVLLPGANASAAANQVLLSAPQEHPAMAENGIPASATAAAGDNVLVPGANDPAAANQVLLSAPQEHPATAENGIPAGVVKAGSAQATGVAAAPAATGKTRVSCRGGTLGISRLKPSGKAVAGSLSELKSIPGTHYTVQIVAGSNKASIEKVASALSGRYWIYETTHEGRPWHVLINGDYSSRAEAAAAASALPCGLQAASPFVKSFAKINSDI